MGKSGGVGSSSLSLHDFFCHRILLIRKNLGKSWNVMSFCQKSWAEGVKISLKIHMLLLLILPGKQRLLRVLWMCFPGKIHGNWKIRDPFFR